jgi:hypothetical protein
VIKGDELEEADDTGWMSAYPVFDMVWNLQGGDIQHLCVAVSLESLDKLLENALVRRTAPGYFYQLWKSAEGFWYCLCVGIFPWYAILHGAACKIVL